MSGRSRSVATIWPTFIQYAYRTRPERAPFHSSEALSVALPRLTTRHGRSSLAIGRLLYQLKDAPFRYSYPRALQLGWGDTEDALITS
jgi:hypothetical protein